MAENYSIIEIKNVRGYIGEKDVPYLNLEDVARGLGIEKKDTKNGKEYIRINKQALKSWLEEFGISNSENELPEFISENVFYKLCFKANNETARKFQDLVCDEILPSIRKRGIYVTNATLENMLNDPNFAIRLFQEIKNEREKNSKLEQTIQEQKPKIEFANQVLSCKDSSISMGDMAKLLKPFYLGRNKLFLCLREWGILMKNNVPYQEYMNRGYFEIKETNKNDRVILVTLVTPKGQQFIVNKFNEEYRKAFGESIIYE